MTPAVKLWLQAASGAAGLILGLAACQAQPDTATELLARQKAIDPPQLWLAQVLGEAGAVKGQVFICADAPMREAFTRARAEVNGHPCLDATSPKVRPNGWTLRCTVGRQAYGESAVTVGDLQKDFLVNFSMTELSYVPMKNHPAYFGPTQDGPAQSVRQVRRFQHVGACPEGWRIGDQAKPGRRPHPAV